MIHLAIWLGAFGVFAAADSWSAITGLGFAAFLALVAAIVAGLTSTTLIHEWFHFAGARICGASFGIPGSSGLFVFDWHYDKNTLQQFYTMSVAGSLGSAAGIALLWLAVPSDTSARAALIASGIASFAYGACIEWPVLKRVRRSRDPLAELTKINQLVLTRSFVVAMVVGLVAWWALI